MGYLVLPVYFEKNYFLLEAARSYDHMDNTVLDYMNDQMIVEHSGYDETEYGT